jgi:hypothetical protein
MGSRVCLPESSSVSLSLGFRVLHFNSSPSTKLVDPLYQKYPVIPLPSLERRRLLVDIRCPVSRTFPHGTLHYQSRPVFLVLSRRFCSLPSGFHVRMYSDFCLIPWTYGTVSLSVSSPSFWLIFCPVLRPSQFRSPLLSGSRLISCLGTKMFQFPSCLASSALFRMLSHVWNPELLLSLSGRRGSTHLAQAYRSV